jgi:predicted nucleotidyltransferase component of viral defense system
MIKKETLTKDWIQEVCKKNRNADPILVEKVIRALFLVEGLSKTNLSFIFKGGTALMLLMDSARRISIDIDIILFKSPKNLEEILQGVAKEQHFNKIELQHRATESDIEKAHYKFFYTPIHNTGKVEEYILLDILFEDNNYKKVSPFKIKSQFLISSTSPVEVQIPSFADLLGDKLTAFAPNTTGIPYFKHDNSMSMEIIKQLYDIGNLVDVTDDLTTVKETFGKIVKTEIAYRKLKNGTADAVLNDVYQTALCLTMRGADGKGNFEELLAGIIRITGYIFSEPYHIDKAITHASKAAYISRLIAADKKEIEKFTSPDTIGDWNIDAPHNTKLNKLKKSNPEAFFYWYKAIEIIK